MNTNRYRSRPSRAVVGLMIVLLGASSCQQMNLAELPLAAEGDEPQPLPAVERMTASDLAADLDSLERDIECYGSVAAEQPSVWGQARLTMYREEFEKTMQAQLNAFHATLQGSLSRSDQAYAADALALSYTAMAATGGLSGGTKGGASSSSSSSVSSGASSAGGGGGSGAGGSGGSSGGGPGGGGTGGGGTGGSGVGSSGGSSGAAASPSGSTGTSSTSGAFDAFNSVQRNPAHLANPFGFASASGSGNGGISLEPTVYLDQMKRYIDHLHELRRMSDGDDTADAPGYSLNLVRIPVSVLPGRQTEQRYGAEITFILRPHLHDELLPMTFRNLVLNDLIDQIGVPLTQTLNDQQWQRAMNEVWNSIQELSDKDQDAQQQFIDRIAEAMDVNYACKPADLPAGARSFGPGAAPPSAAPPVNRLSSARMTKALAHYRDVQHRGQLAVQSSTRLRTSHRPFPPSQLVDIYGAHGWAEIVCTAWQLFSKDVPNKDVIHYPDVQNYLQEEISAGYSFLKTPDARPFWDLCSPEFANDIHSRRMGAISTRRCGFEANAQALANVAATPGSAVKSGVTTALAWAVLVDSTLLNQQLIEDMKQAPIARGGNFVPANCAPDKWPAYFLPDPEKPEREAFNEYVRCRWPLHVFALDPELDQENIADSYSSRREMQLAMSLAFVSGKLSASNMFRYARRLETDMEAIALNNTMVGFSHGTDTFGWRFYPRYQTPDTPSNLHVLLQDMLCGGPTRKQLLRQRQLEPGIRECVAIVLMPSFVPYADLDASSNWFALDNPRRKLMNSRRAIRLGEELKFIRNSSQAVCDAQCTRDGDLERLIRRSEQLEARLPLQSMSVQVPYENTLGGFAMFSTGVTDLAPELLGWYGAPAINLDAPTTIFLIGNHFSVHQTRVVVGGQEITNTELLSRQVMKVTIPPNAIALIEKSGTIAGGWKQPGGPMNLPSSQTTSPVTLEDRAASAPGTTTVSQSAPTTPNSPLPGHNAAQDETKAVAKPEILPAALSDDATLRTAPVGAPSMPDTSAAAPTAPGTQAAGTSPTTPSAASSSLASAQPPAVAATPTSPTTISAPSSALLNLGRSSMLTFSANGDHANSIILSDPQEDAPDEHVTLSVNHGSLTLGITQGLTFLDGANGAASLTVQGRLPDLNRALEGMTYLPNTGFAGAETLTLSFNGKGTPATCKISVAITVNQAWPDYLYVDLQLATPYGTTSHLLVPAWHLGKTASGNLPLPIADATVVVPAGGNGSSAGSQAQWSTSSWTVGYTSKPAGIALSEPPSFTPASLALNLGPNYQVPTDGNVSLKMALEGKSTGAIAPVTIAIKPVNTGTTGGNYDPKTHTLTVSGTDLNNLAINVFAVIGPQFGRSNPVSSTNNSVALDTTISGTGQSDVKVGNALTVKLAAPAPAPGLASSTSPTGSHGSTETK